MLWSGLNTNLKRFIFYVFVEVFINGHRHIKLTNQNQNYPIWKRFAQKLKKTKNLHEIFLNFKNSENGVSPHTTA
jgi:hypothetical protein